MAEHSRERVAVYLDFDNIVISRYNQLHGKNQFAKDKVRSHLATNSAADPVITARITDATVDVGAILDYASSFGAIVISRAYADWSAAVNARYHRQLTDRAVDLTQLFPTVLSLKNGADIRLAVDVVEDVFRLADLTHIVIVAGDSDYIPLAQRCKRLGRYVVGIGVSGATSSSLAAACDEFADYDSLPGIVRPTTTPAATATAAKPSARSRTPTGKQGAGKATGASKDPMVESDVAASPTPQSKAEQPPNAQLNPQPNPQPNAQLNAQTNPKAGKAATALLLRAMELLAKNDREWQHASELKNQMRRMDPSFQERTLGYSQFSDFLRSRAAVLELEQKSPSSPVLLRVRR